MNQLRNSYKPYVCKILTPHAEHMMFGDVIYITGGRKSTIFKGIFRNATGATVHILFLIN